MLSILPLDSYKLIHSYNLLFEKPKNMKCETKLRIVPIRLRQTDPNT